MSTRNPDIITGEAQWRKILEDLQTAAYGASKCCDYICYQCCSASGQLDEILNVSGSTSQVQAEKILSKARTTVGDVAEKVSASRAAEKIDKHNVATRAEKGMLREVAGLAHRQIQTHTQRADPIPPELSEIAQRVRAIEGQGDSVVQNRVEDFLYLLGRSANRAGAGPSAGPQAAEMSRDRRQQYAKSDAEGEIGDWEEVFKKAWKDAGLGEHCDALASDFGSLVRQSQLEVRTQSTWGEFFKGS